MKLKLHDGWTILGKHGIYYDSFSRTRREAISGHCAALGKTWDYCKRKGDVVIRTSLYARSPI